MKICIVDASNPKIPSGNEKYRNFENYSSYEDGNWRSYKSYAAALGTEFFAYNGEKFENVYKYDGILLLTDTHFSDLVPFVRKLRMMNKKVLIAYHESMHIADNLPAHGLNNFFQLKELISIANGYWNLNTPNGDYFFEVAFDTNVFGVPTGAPYRLWNLDDLRLPASQREGIVVLTRTIDQSRLKRNSLVAIGTALKVAEEVDTFVSYTNEDPPFVGEFLKELYKNKPLRIFDRQEKYIDWLKFISKHKIAFQLDNSYSHGQTITDCALVNVPCLGGLLDNSKLLQQNFLDYFPCDANVFTSTDTHDAYLSLRDWYEEVNFVGHSINIDECFAEYAEALYDFQRIKDGIIGAFERC